ncbi:MAG: hypothetical protein K9M57_05230 [Phycisphaerae bacterium]|nr:hypothetical protein [Phycisphaerae bacterium]
MRVHLIGIIGIFVAISLWSMPLSAGEKIPTAKPPESGVQKVPPALNNVPMERWHGERVGTEELLTFLNTHEPLLAQSLQKLEKINKNDYKRKVDMLRRLYSRTIRQMAINPEMGKLMLIRISLKARIENTAREIRNSEKKTNIKKLKTQVSDLFDIIVKQEEMRLDSWTKRIEESTGPGQSEKSEPSKEGRDKEIIERSALQKGLDERKKLIERWRKNKYKIVDQRAEELINKKQAFPWR